MARVFSKLQRTRCVRADVPTVHGHPVSVLVACGGGGFSLFSNPDISTHLGRPAVMVVSRHKYAAAAPISVHNAIMLSGHVVAWVAFARRFTWSFRNPEHTHSHLPLSAHRKHTRARTPQPGHVCASYWTPSPLCSCALQLSLMQQNRSRGRCAPVVLLARRVSDGALFHVHYPRAVLPRQRLGRVHRQDVDDTVHHRPRDVQCGAVYVRMFAVQWVSLASWRLQVGAGGCSGRGTVAQSQCSSFVARVACVN